MDPRHEFEGHDTKILVDDTLATVPSQPAVHLPTHVIYAQSGTSIDALPYNSATTRTNGLSLKTRKRSSSAAFAVMIPPRFAALPYSTSRTGIVYDDRMRFHVDSDPTQDHPEQPRRILEIFTELTEAGLVAKPHSTDLKAEFQLLPIEIRAASDEEILLVHSQAHLDFVQELAGSFVDFP